MGLERIGWVAVLVALVFGGIGCANVVANSRTSTIVPGTAKTVDAAPERLIWLTPEGREPLDAARIPLHTTNIDAMLSFYTEVVGLRAFAVHADGAFAVLAGSVGSCAAVIPWVATSMCSVGPTRDRLRSPGSGETSSPC